MQKGEVIAKIHANSENKLAVAKQEILQTIKICPNQAKEIKTILDIMI